MIKIQKQSMFEILMLCEEQIKSLEASQLLDINIPNPDLESSLHSWRAWIDLASLLFCRMLTPKVLDQRVILSFQKLSSSTSFHNAEIQSKEEKYGRESLFATIHKNEEPAFLFSYRQALKQVNIAKRRRVLDLGVNSGDEFEIIQKMVNRSIYEQMSLIGVDHSPSAIEYAQNRFNHSNITFHCHDINDLESLNLPKSDLIISIGTLQSPSIPFKTFFMSLIQNYLSFDGAVILGFPNSRWIDGEMIYGAKAPNYPFSEMSLLIKDIYFCKKYLQQHKFRVTITGKEYLFLTATKIGLRD